MYMYISTRVNPPCELVHRELHLSKPGGGNVTEPGVEPTSSGCMTGDSTHSSEKVSCDEWYWNPSPDISGYMCVAATAHNIT